MPIEEYFITEAVREKAKAIAIERLRLWGQWEREDYFEAYTPLERNWQGCIAEVFLRQIYPQLQLGQPYVVEGENITECDYIYHEEGVELKCNRFSRMWNHFLKNVDEHRHKGHTAKVLICTAINAPPARAVKFWIFGWIPMEEVEECEVWRSEVSPNIKSPAYAIPREQLRGLADLFKPGDWNLGNFMPR